MSGFLYFTIQYLHTQVGPYPRGAAAKYSPPPTAHDIRHPHEHINHIAIWG